MGYLLTAATGWSMLNNKVHWASDSPLGLGIGYVAGKIATHHQRKKQFEKEALPL
ncbi:MAG TPA: hypothetical protein VET23_05020 [Chitinophagaceae bacterium]|nr:hypothetical protein [Chitinophagaceae bacterium]